MPAYEYQCKECGHVFEREHPIGEKKKYRCPDCASGRTHKIISQVGVIFKGTGFYITDHRKKNGERDKKPSKVKSSESTDKNTPASEN